MRGGAFARALTAGAVIAIATRAQSATQPPATDSTSKLAEPAPDTPKAPDAAQSSEAPATTAAQAMIQDIVVTARKKSAAERAQDVPIALSAVSGAQIEASFAQNLSEVGMSMPNVRLDDGGAFPGVANYTVRGMGFNSTIASVEPTVGSFVDGIYIGSNLGGLQDTLDLDSVEVLRGPQGTLFGRNVTGGAVVTRSRRPTGEFGGVLRAGVGAGNLYEGAAGVEGPLTDAIAGKVFASYGNQDGLFHNITTGRRHGRDETYLVRPMLRWRPNPDLDITLLGEHGHTNADGVANRFVDDPNQLLYKQGVRQPVGTDTLTDNFDGQTTIDYGQAILDANWKVGPGTITSITGYRAVSYFSTGDTDGSQSETARASNRLDQHQFSEELRYAGRAFGGKLDYTVGAYYFQQRMEQFYQVLFFGASNQRSGGILRHRTALVFAQGDLEFLPCLFLTLGGRYTWERKHALNARTPDCDLQLNCNFSDSGGHTWTSFTRYAHIPHLIYPVVV